jgi:hypothetical protein
VTEIDWHKVYVARLSACCQRAAADLNLSITSPFILNPEEGDEHRFVALFPRIGPLNGTLVCLAADWEKLSDIAHTSSSTYLDFNALAQLKGDAARDPSKAVRNPRSLT